MFVLFTIAATMGLFLASEALFGAMNFINDKWVGRRVDEVYQQRYVNRDETLGYRPYPNLNVPAVLKLRNKIIYSARYTIDEFGRRSTPVDATGGVERDRFLLFFGCSFTFGDGVNDRETMPYYAGQAAPAYTPYNYAFSGYGPQQMLVRLQSTPIEDEVKEKKGALVYLFIDPHIQRLIGSMYVYNKWGEDMPFFRMRDGRLTREGSFKSGRKTLSVIYRLLGKLQIVKFLRLDFPKINQNHLRLLAEVIKESKNEFNKKFDGEFYVVIYPGSKYGERLKPHLKDAGISFFDYSNLFDSKDPSLFFDVDQHPTPAAQRLLALRLTQDLGIGARGHAV